MSSQVYAAAPPRALPAQPAEQGAARDHRWLTLVFIVGGLYLLGVLFAWRVGPSLDYSFSARVSSVFWPLAMAAILLLGFTPRGYAIAAGVFYSFLPLSQVASETYFLFGENSTVVTAEMVLAVPLIVTAWLGPRGLEQPARRLPSLLVAACWMFVGAALLSSALAEDPLIALTATVSRFLLPVLVTLGSVRRMRDLNDVWLLWLGLAMGIAIIALFDVRRMIFGEVVSYGTGAGQRFAGATMSYTLPALLTVGPALWLGHTLAIRKSPLHGLPWLVLAGAIGLLAWLGGHRGPTVFFGLLVLWWIPGHPLRHLLSLRAIVSTILVGVAVTWLVMYALRETTASLTLTADRLRELQETGLQGQIRWVLWAEGLGYWLSSPIWGIGPNNWVLLNTDFESAHSSVVALLYDVGALGATAFGLILFSVLRIARMSQLVGLDPIQREFYLGFRAAWVVMLGLLCVNLPFTSGQPKNSIFAYAVFLFPLVAMVAYMRYAPPARREPALYITHPVFTRGLATPAGPRPTPP